MLGVTGGVRGERGGGRRRQLVSGSRENSYFCRSQTRRGMGTVAPFPLPRPPPPSLLAGCLLSPAQRTSPAHTLTPTASPGGQTQVNRVYISLSDLQWMEYFCSSTVRIARHLSPPQTPPPPARGPHTSRDRIFCFPAVSVPCFFTCISKECLMASLL